MWKFGKGYGVWNSGAASVVRDVTFHGLRTIQLGWRAQMGGATLGYFPTRRAAVAAVEAVA